VHFGIPGDKNQHIYTTVESQGIDVGAGGGGGGLTFLR